MNDEKTRTQQIVDAVRHHWRLLLIIPILIGGVILYSRQQNQVASIQTQISEQETALNDLKAERTKLENLNLDEVGEVVEVQGVNAQQMGKDMKKAQEILRPEADNMSSLSGQPEGYEEAKALLGKYLNTDGEPANDGQVNEQSWLKGADWTLELETAITYASNSMPVLFSARNGNGELMATIEADYNASNETLTNIDYILTSKGERGGSHVFATYEEGTPEYEGAQEYAASSESAQQTISDIIQDSVDKYQNGDSSNESEVESNG